MNLSKDTLAIFKNFANINSNLTLKEGNKITTISTGKNIIAEAKVAESFPCDFGVYDLNEFLGVLSLFDNPVLDWSTKYVFIRDASSSPTSKNGVKYFAASASVLTPTPQMKAFPPADIEFKLSSSMLNQIQRVASILKVADFSFVGDGTTIVVQVGDKTNATSNTFSSEIGTTDKTFKVNFKVENLKMVSADYNVTIGGKKISRFDAVNSDLTYYCAIELDSSFDF